MNGFVQLQNIVTILRGEHGCPWDIKQTPVSLKKYLIEECKELTEAIDIGGDDHICEEIGDMFFVLTMLINCFSEQQKFTTDDVFHKIVAKMIRRHPHVFAGKNVKSEEELRDQWETIKLLEK